MRFSQGEFTKLESLQKLKAGSVIRCEQKGHRWLVDGKLVASSLASDDTFHFENEFLPPTGHVSNGTKDEIIPCFSGKGVSHYIPFLCVVTSCAYLLRVVLLHQHWTLSQIVLSCP